MSEQPENARWVASPSRRGLVHGAARAIRELLPDEPNFRTLRFGLARGCTLPVNLRKDLRTWLGLYEVEISRWVRRLLRKDEVSYDIGAREGYYTVALAARAPLGHVVAIEPDSRSVALLRQTLARNQAVGRRVTVVDQSLADDTVDGTTIDDLARQFDSPGLIKMDVDGGEFGILSRAENVLNSARPAIVLETHGYALEAHCLALLADAGYRYRVINNQRLVPELRPLEMNRWVIAVHREDARSVVL